MVIFWLTLLTLICSDLPGHASIIPQRDFGACEPPQGSLAVREDTFSSIEAQIRFLLLRLSRSMAVLAGALLASRFFRDAKYDVAGFIRNCEACCSTPMKCVVLHKALRLVHSGCYRRKGGSDLLKSRLTVGVLPMKSNPKHSHSPIRITFSVFAVMSARNYRF